MEKDEVKRLLKTTFDNQLREVGYKYSLVIAALLLKNDTIAKIVEQRFPVDSLDVLEAISIRDGREIEAIGDHIVLSAGIRLTQRLKDLFRDLGISKNDDETKAAFERFSKGLAGGGETHRKCPKCGGEGTVNGEPCTRCGGNGYI